MKTKLSRILSLMFISGLFAAATLIVARPAQAMPLSQVINTIREANGHYAAGGASLSGADCSGLISVAQSLATGAPIRRLGNTHSLLAGQWPGVLPGATPGDRFIIAATSSHMMAQIDGVGIESTTSGRPFTIGPAAKSVWSPGYRQFHVDERMLVT